MQGLRAGATPSYHIRIGQAQLSYPHWPGPAIIPLSFPLSYPIHSPTYSYHTQYTAHHTAIIPNTQPIIQLSYPIHSPSYRYHTQYTAHHTAIIPALVVSQLGLPLGFESSLGVESCYRYNKGTGLGYRGPSTYCVASMSSVTARASV